MRLFISQIFFFYSFLLFAQAEDNFPIKLSASFEDFKLVTEMTEISEEQIYIIKDFCHQYSRFSQDTALLIAEKMTDITKDYPDGIIKAEAKITHANVWQSMGKFKEAKQFLLEAKLIATKLGNDNLIANTLKKLGTIDVRQDQYDSALEYFLGSLAVSEKLKDSTQMFSIYFNIAGLYFNLSMLDKTKEYTQKAADIAEATNDDGLRVDAYGAQASIFGQVAADFLDKYEKDTVNLKIYKDSSKIFSHYALQKSEEVLVLAGESNNKVLLAGTLVKMVVEYNNLEEYKQAIEVGKKAEMIIDELGYNYFQSQNYNYLAFAYLRLGDNVSALDYAQKSLKSAEEMGLEVLIGSSHDYLSTIYAGLGNHKMAFESLKKYDDYLAKTNNLEKIQSISDADAKYESVKKENRILAQENSILELETSNAYMTRQRGALLGGGILLAFLSFMAYNFFRIRRERNDKKAFTEALIFAQEAERKRIAGDLHDGIGQSLLLIKKQMAMTHQTTTENNQLINDTLEEVRTISQNLHPFHLGKFGLTTAIKDMIKKVEQSTTLFISKDIEDIDNFFSEKEQIQFLE